jgi:hydrogenase nickel incorporation protein HypA/HybF
MHELSITRNIVAIVDEAARGRHVRRVTLQIGKLSGVMPGAVAFCFDIVAQGTALAGARLNIEEIEGRARCKACGGEYVMPHLAAPCPCGSRQVALLRGEELKIATMEIEEAA